MRRLEREIKDPAEIEDILMKGKICHLGLNDGGLPYVVPLNYGYAERCLYIHSAPEGRKIDVLKRDSRVAFSVYIDDKLVEHDENCRWGMKYRCVMGEGRAAILTGEAEKEMCLGIIMRHHGSARPGFNAVEVGKVVIIKVGITGLTGKKAGY